jgi:hypothetical protein
VPPGTVAGIALPFMVQATKTTPKYDGDWIYFINFIITVVVISWDSHRPMNLHSV